MTGAQLLQTWKTLQRVPMGSRVASRAIGAYAPYTGTLGGQIEALEPGFCRVRLDERRAVRNHLRSIHAIALMNLGEMTTGLAMYTGLPKGGKGIITELNMRYLKKARGRITAEAHCDLPQDAGDHDVQIVAELKDVAGDVVAEARAVWRVRLT